jgi:hypothetical protein
VNVVIGSAFRNAAGRQMSNYVRQLELLRKRLNSYGHTLSWIAAEGDSHDNTRIELQRYAAQLPIELRLAVREHGLGWFGSVETAERMKALSYVGNGILESVRDEDDVLVYVESDLMWTATTIAALVDTLTVCDVVSPLVFAGNNFYDVWAFRGLDGERFAPFHPYHQSIAEGGVATLIEVSSVGSCLVMRGEVARKCRIRDGGALVSFCHDVRCHGYKIFVNPTLRIDHPC